jgi:predicted transposase/invertase (TIGR01784 family)
MTFLDLRTDFAFKKVFGSADSKPRLISFLNALIQFGDDCKVTHLDIVDPYNVPKLKGMKNTFVDVKAVLSDESTVIIEMQVLNLDGFEKPVLYNAAKNYSIRLKKDDPHHFSKPIIALTLVNFEMFSENDNLVNEFKLINKRELTAYNHDIELVFIELPKFTKTREQCESIADDWLYFLKNASKLDALPENLPTIVQSAYKASNEAKMSAEELKLQHKKKEWITTHLDALSLAQKKGEVKGELNKAKEGAVNLLRLNVLSDEQIGEAMGLSVEQILGLK